MLSDDYEKQARKRWMDMFENTYSKHESMFRYGSELCIVDKESLKMYGEDGLEYTLQIAPWELIGNAPKWIRFENFLPLDGQKVLITVDDTGVLPQVEFATFHSKGLNTGGRTNYFEQNGFVVGYPNEEVTAWMPLPEPYTENGTESDY